MVYRAAEGEADAVFVKDRVISFPAAGCAGPKGPVGYNMLVPRRETGTDWKHTHAHTQIRPPTSEPPRTQSGIIIL